MLRAGRTNHSGVHHCAFRANDKKWQDTRLRDIVLSVRDIGLLFAAHADLIRPFLREGSGAATGRRGEISRASKRCCRSSRNWPSAGRLLQLLGTQPNRCCGRYRKLLGHCSKRRPSVRRPRYVTKRSGCWPESWGMTLSPGSDTGRRLKNATVQETIANAARELDGERSDQPTEQELPPHEPIQLTPLVTPALRDCFRRCWRNTMPMPRPIIIASPLARQDSTSTRIKDAHHRSQFQCCRQRCAADGAGRFVPRAFATTLACGDISERHEGRSRPSLNIPICN